MPLRLGEHFNIVVNGFVEEFDSKEKRKRKRTVENGLAILSCLADERC